jgi:hypothetical protein
MTITPSELILGGAGIGTAVAEQVPLGVVNIFLDGGSYLPAFPSARKMALHLDDVATFAHQPVETGFSITDHMVIQPKTITIKFLIIGEFFQVTYLQVKQYFLNKQAFIIQNKTDIHQNMYIVSKAHTEAKAPVLGIAMTLIFKELLVFDQQDAGGSVSSDPAKQDTVDRGTVGEETESRQEIIQLPWESITQDNVPILTVPIFTFSITSFHLALVPNQRFNIVVNSTTYEVHLKFTGSVMVLSLRQGDLDIILGARCCANSFVIHYPHLTSKYGDFFFITKNMEYPDWSMFGKEQRLLYCSPDDLESLRNA